jgi:hypothetical protein
MFAFRGFAAGLEGGRMGGTKFGLRSRSGVWAMLFCSSISMFGCRDLGPTNFSSSSSNTANNPVGGSKDLTATNDAFKVMLTAVSEDKVIDDYFLHSQASFSSACSISPGTSTPNNDIYCYLDVSELDLFYNGISFRFNSPPGMCAYTKLRPYVFWRHKPGSVGAGTTCTVTQDQTNGTVNQACTAGSNLTWNGATYDCNFDYSANGGSGPNCCTGAYTLTNVTITSTGTSISSSVVKMTGAYQNCYAGPGKDLTGFQDKDGWPTTVYYKDSGSGYNSRIDITAPIDKDAGTNLYLGNYWNPTYFQRNGVETGSFPLADTGNVPKALTPLTLSGATDVVQPYYDFLCMDKADDTVARIRVLVRSWDTVSNFTAQSNPYTDPTTHEPGFNPDYFLHDRGVWNDFSPTTIVLGDVYPGAIF